MKISRILAVTLMSFAAFSTSAESQYLVRVPANVNLSAATPETPSEPVSVVLSQEALPEAMVNTPYSFNLADRLSITGGTGSYNLGDVAWSLTAGNALPPGLALENGTIAGTPTVKNEAGTAFEVTGTYQDASGSQIYTLVVGGQVLKATQVSVSNSMGCALTISGGVKCWGKFIYGDPIPSPAPVRTSPVTIQGWESGVERIRVGGDRACAIRSSGMLECFGSGNSSGKMGDGGSSSRGLPVVIPDLRGRVLDVGLGNFAGCALLDNSEVWCWGNNDYGQVGDGTTTNRFSPVKVSDLQAKAISVGQSSVCAVDTGNRALCWGRNSYGILGDGTETPRAIPTPVSGLPASVKAIQVGNSFSCALMNDGALKCWGGNWYGQLGNGGATNSTTPTNVSGLQSSVLDIELGDHHACASHVSQGLLCWGANDSKQLGNATLGTMSVVPAQVAGFGQGVASFSAGGTTTCAITPAGSTKCWGANSAGELGDGSTTQRNTPVDVLPGN